MGVADSRCPGNCAACFAQGYIRSPGNPAESVESRAPRRLVSVIITSASGITFESHARFVQEFSSHREIDLGARQLPVPHINRQLRQEFLHVLAFAVPRCQSMNCRRVAQVMKARLAAGTNRRGADRHAFGFAGKPFQTCGRECASSSVQ